MPWLQLQRRSRHHLIVRVMLCQCARSLFVVFLSLKANNAIPEWPRSSWWTSNLHYCLMRAVENVSCAKKTPWMMRSCLVCDSICLTHNLQECRKETRSKSEKEVEWRCLAKSKSGRSGLISSDQNKPSILLSWHKWYTGRRHESNRYRTQPGEQIYLVLICIRN